VTLHNMSITASKDANTPLGMEATARTYRYLDADEIAATRAAAAAAAKKKPGAKK
jgi:type IV pilus assembly protein PilO